MPWWGRRSSRLHSKEPASPVPPSESTDVEQLSRRFAERARRQALQLLTPLLREPVVGSCDEVQPYAQTMTEQSDGSWLRVSLENSSSLGSGVSPGRGMALNDGATESGGAVPIEADFVERVGGVTVLGVVSLERGTPLYAETARVLRVLEARGCSVDHVVLVRVQKGYTFVDRIDPGELFERQDITVSVRGAADRLERRDEGSVGADTCGDGEKEARSPADVAPAVDDPRTLFLGKKRGEELVAAGIVSLHDLPPDVALSRRQTIQVAAVRRGAPHVDHTAVRSFLDDLRYPVAYLDFEAFSTPVPPFAGARAWEHIPYLYTAQIVARDGAAPELRWYLSRDAAGDERTFCDTLLDDLGDAGSIVVYGRDFEARAIARMAERYRERSSELRTLTERIVDLSALFSGFAYYHPLQRGSVSMKTVLPILSGRGYDDLPVRNGRQANLLGAVAVLSGEPLSDTHVRGLVDYCARDTEGMVWMVEALSRL